MTHTATQQQNTWYAIVAWGSHPAPARGPFASVEDALDAARRFRQRVGSQAGTYLAAGSVRIVGPYATRDLARHADISDGRTVREVR